MTGGLQGVAAVTRSLDVLPLNRELLDGTGHNAPDLDRLPILGRDVRLGWVGGLELDAPGALV